MALSDLAAQAPAETPWRTCQVCHELSRIPEAEAAGLRALLANASLRFTSIQRMIAEDEDTPLRIGVDALSRHARGRCEAREVLR